MDMAQTSTQATICYCVTLRLNTSPQYLFVPYSNRDMEYGTNKSNEPLIMDCKKTTQSVFTKVVEEVIDGTRLIFQDEGVDEQVLEELRTLWTDKFKKASGAKPVTVSSPPVKDLVPVCLKLPKSQTYPARDLIVNVPTGCLQSVPFDKLFTGEVLSKCLSMPITVASQVIQKHIDDYFDKQKTVNQQDGADDSSDEDDDELESELLKDEEEFEAEGDVREESLNSDDDVTEDDSVDLFETENIIICLYEKVSRSRNKWRFILNKGIAHLGGEDYTFQRATGDAEW